MQEENIGFQLDIGKLGEDIACIFLKNKNFSIIERNYRKRYGEIDIVAKKNKKVHFIEVKSISHEISQNGVIHETLFNPEDAIQAWKIERMRRVIQSYLLEKSFLKDKEWQFDVIAVFIDARKKISKVRFRENMIL